MSHQVRKTHIVLTSHPSYIYKESPELHWGAKDPVQRGPVVASLTNKLHRNAIGTHSGSYTVYRALATAAGKIVTNKKDVAVTKAAIDPVWYLPGIAERFGLSEVELRKALFEETGGMFPELITRPELKVLLPPIGSTTVYMFGDVTKLGEA